MGKEENTAQPHQPCKQCRHVGFLLDFKEPSWLVRVNSSRRVRKEKVSSCLQLPQSGSWSPQGHSRALQTWAEGGSWRGRAACEVPGSACSPAVVPPDKLLRPLSRKRREQPKKKKKKAAKLGSNFLFFSSLLGEITLQGLRLVCSFCIFP